MLSIDWFVRCCSSAPLEGNQLPHVPENGLAEDNAEASFSSWQPPIERYNRLCVDGSVPDVYTPSMTPRQRELSKLVQLPDLTSYPTPPGDKIYYSDDEKRQALLEVYKEFVLELHAGMYLTQLTSTRDYSDIHCQLMDDLKTLKLDQSNGRIIEFPLNAVSKVYRIVKNDDKWYNAGSLTTAIPVLQLQSTEHIVVVEFMRRKLAFVFENLEASQRFLMCMELLIRRAQLGNGTLRKHMRTSLASGNNMDMKTPFVAKLSL